MKDPAGCDHNMSGGLALSRAVRHDDFGDPLATGRGGPGQEAFARKTNIHQNYVHLPFPVAANACESRNDDGIKRIALTVA
jgi:hypothetical protein